MEEAKKTNGGDVVDSGARKDQTIDTGARKAILRFATMLHGALATHPAARATVDQAFDELRIELGDDDFADHVILREHAQAQLDLDTFGGDNAKDRRRLEKRVEKAEKAMQARPSALKKHEQLSDLRKEARKVAAAEAAAQADKD